MSVSREQIHEVLARLYAEFPNTFFIYQGRRKPLKVGIRCDIEAVLDVDRKQLRAALKFYALNIGYLKSQKVGGERIDLNGNPVGVVTESEAENANKAIPWLLAMSQRRKLVKPKRDGLSALRQAARKRQAAAVGGGA